MAPHIHVPSCKSTAGRASVCASAHSNAEKALDVFIGSSNNTVRVQPNIQIHPTDITHFVQVGFDEQINLFATRSGFQPAIIQDVYKNVSSYKDTQKVVKAMRIAAMESAKVEIEHLRNERLREDSDSDSEDLYERPKKAKANTEPKEEENN